MKNISQNRNTYKSGRAKVFVYEAKGNFVGVCLDFGLVIKAKTFEKAKECIIDVTESYMSNILENKLPERLLNRSAPRKYWKVYEEIIGREKELAQLQQRSISRSSEDISSVRIPVFLVLNQDYRNGVFSS